MNLSEPQPLPNKNSEPAVWDLVRRDIADREAYGMKKYGTRLHLHNGRDFLIDAYQEALDLTVYLRGAIYERTLPESEINSLVSRLTSLPEGLKNQKSFLTLMLWVLKRIGSEVRIPMEDLLEDEEGAIILVEIDKVKDELILKVGKHE